MVLDAPVRMATKKGLWQDVRYRLLPGGKHWNTYPWYGKVFTVCLVYLVVILGSTPVLMQVLPESWQYAEWGGLGGDIGIIGVLLFVALEGLAMVVGWFTGIAFWAWHKGRSPFWCAALSLIPGGVVIFLVLCRNKRLGRKGLGSPETGSDEGSSLMDWKLAMYLFINFVTLVAYVLLFGIAWNISQLLVYSIGDQSLYDFYRGIVFIISLVPMLFIELRRHRELSYWVFRAEGKAWRSVGGNIVFNVVSILVLILLPYVSAWVIVGVVISEILRYLFLARVSFVAEVVAVKFKALY